MTAAPIPFTLGPDAREFAIDGRNPRITPALSITEQHQSLVAAANRCCDASGEDDANRAALIAECGQLEPHEQEDMRDHFYSEAATWDRANRGIAP